MTQTQKIIKYLALSLAIILIITIFSAIITGIYGISNFLGLNHKQKVGELKELSCLTTGTETIPTDLKIDLNYTDLVIKYGDKFKIETTDPSIKCKSKNSTLVIKDKKNYFNVTTKQKLVISLINTETFSDIDISTGAGSLEIDKLITKKLNLDLGAGKTTINELISNDTEIDTGAGEFTIKSGTINDLDFDIGVGKTTITANITGNSKIDSGVGSLNLNILNSKENYRLKLSKGIGTIKVDNEEIKDNEIFGNGFHTLTIDGGVGEINIKFKGD